MELPRIWILLLLTCSFIHFGSAQTQRSGNLRKSTPPKTSVTTFFSRNEMDVISNDRKYRLFAVRGHGKSGTNWLRNILNLHPEINCVGEMNIEAELHIRSLFPESSGKAFPNLPTIQPSQWLFHQYGKAIEEGGKDLYARLVVESSSSLAFQNNKVDDTGNLINSVSVIGEHSPQQIGFPFIAKLPTFYIVRDGRDVVVSWAFHLLNICIRLGNDDCDIYDSAFDDASRQRLAAKVRRHAADPQYYIQNPHELFASDETYDDGFWVRDLAQSWQSFKEVHSKYWHRSNKDDYGYMQSSCFENENASVYTVFYETLHNRTTGEAHKLYQYLHLDPDAAEAPSTTTHTLPGMFKGSGKSFYRKGAAGDWQNYATQTFVTSFKAAAQDALEFYGYEPDASWGA